MNSYSVDGINWKNTRSSIFVLFYRLRILNKSWKGMD